MAKRSTPEKWFTDLRFLRAEKVGGWGLEEDFWTKLEKILVKGMALDCCKKETLSVLVI